MSGWEPYIIYIYIYNLIITIGEDDLKPKYYKSTSIKYYKKEKKCYFE